MDMYEEFHRIGTFAPAIERHHHHAHFRFHQPVQPRVDLPQPADPSHSVAVSMCWFENVRCGSSDVILLRLRIKIHTTQQISPPIPIPQT
jgi:hypothetical protein